MSDSDSESDSEFREDEMGDEGDEGDETSSGAEDEFKTYATRVYPHNALMIAVEVVMDEGSDSGSEEGSEEDEGDEGDEEGGEPDNDNIELFNLGEVEEPLSTDQYSWLMRLYLILRNVKDTADFQNENVRALFEDKFASAVEMHELLPMLKELTREWFFLRTGLAKDLDVFNSMKMVPVDKSRAFVDQNSLGAKIRISREEQETLAEYRRRLDQSSQEVTALQQQAQMALLSLSV